MTSKDLSSSPKVKRVKKYKYKLKVMDSGALRPTCSCGWESDVSFAQFSGLAAAIEAANDYYSTHTHIKKVKKKA